jgi:hypothetical protein
MPPRCLGITREVVEERHPEQPLERRASGAHGVFQFTGGPPERLVGEHPAVVVLGEDPAGGRQPQRPVQVERVRPDRFGRLGDRARSPGQVVGHATALTARPRTRAPWRGP